MSTASSPEIRIDPELTSKQLFDFYRRNNICEVGFGEAVAARILEHPHVIVAAFAEDELVGLARATFDGLSAHIMEFSLDLRWQGGTTYANGSLVERDPSGLGHALGTRLLTELEARGCTFVDGVIVADCEEAVYESLGFRENVGHRVVYIDRRPYAAEE